MKKSNLKRKYQIKSKNGARIIIDFFYGQLKYLPEVGIFSFK